MRSPKKKSNQPAASGTGKGTLLIDNNPMLGTRERSAQLNNLGKHGETKGERTHHVKTPKDI